MASRMRSMTPPRSASLILSASAWSSASLFLVRSICAWMRSMVGSVGVAIRFLPLGCGGRTNLLALLPPLDDREAQHLQQWVPVTAFDHDDAVAGCAAEAEDLGALGGDVVIHVRHDAVQLD